MKYLKAIWQFCSYLFVPQMGRERRRKEKLKQCITYLIGKERAEGNLEHLTPEYVSRVLNANIDEVEKCLKGIEM
ncbi:MAG: hypothetical protein Q4F34_09310 [Prevotellaceae bacterium]|nr:hypothetical protein [Prevotellaceae bacterium]